MTPNEFIEKHKATVKNCLKNLAIAYEVQTKTALFDEVEADITGDVFLWATTQDEGKLGEIGWRYVFSMVRTSFIQSWRRRSVVTYPPGKEAEISSISEFSEELLANKLADPIYYDRGGCTRFNVSPIYGPFPGFEDLDFNDQTALVEFCNLRAVNNTRQGPARRLVDSILRKIDIESGDVHDYTTRRRP